MATGPCVMRAQPKCGICRPRLRRSRPHWRCWAASARWGCVRGRSRLGETVVVLGLGLIGQFAAQLARVAGARPVIGVDLFPNRVEIAQAGGICALNPNESDVAQTVNAVTAGRMAEVVIEATGNPAVIPQALELAGDGGRVVLLGSPRGTVEIDPYSAVHHKGVSLIGAHAARIRACVHRPRSVDA